ncbi:MAG: acylneuraminate cytidylyltransferase family protein [Nitrosopumilus sp.]|nr:acylneuraminate cytidylyltransferase family protein [Nitrosopumilus sp.]
MRGGRDVVCIILARGGSKGIPRKNVRLLRGRPLITHSIDVAKQVDQIDRVLVSTDDAEIRRVAEEAGAEVVDRPAELATDTASYVDAVHHLLRAAGIRPETIVVALETTAPLRTKEDVERCIRLYGDDADCVISVTEVKSHPTYMFRMSGGMMAPFDESSRPGNRQEMETLYAYTGSILVASAGFLLSQKESVYGGRIRGHVMDERRSIDIDTPLDFEICEHVMGLPD